MSRIGTVCGFLVAMFFALSSRATSFDAACESLPSLPLVTVSTLPVTVDEQILDGHMRHMTIATTGEASLHERTTVGTTIATRTWEASYELSLIRNPASGRVCYRPSIKVVVGYEPMQIAVANPFRSGSCAHDAIVAHEREHVNIYSQFLAGASQSIASVLRDVISGDVRHAQSLDAANSQMRQLLRAQVHEVVRTEMDKAQEMHDRFDSHEESLRLLNACDGEVRRTLSNTVLASR